MYSDLFAWLADAKGKAIKVVAPLLAGLPARSGSGDKQQGGSEDQGKGKAPPTGEKLHYRVLFMDRDMGEVLLSQERMLASRGKESDAGGGEDAAPGGRDTPAPSVGHDVGKA